MNETPTSEPVPDATFERDEEIDGWKIQLTGYPGAFYVKRSQLETMGKSLVEYMEWLIQAKPRR
jgi:hypothetical protein